MNDPPIVRDLLGPVCGALASLASQRGQRRSSGSIALHRGKPRTSTPALAIAAWLVLEGSVLDIVAAPGRALPWEAGKVATATRVASALSELTGKAYVVDARIRGRKVLIAAKELSAELLLIAIKEVWGLAVREVGDVAFITYAEQSAYETATGSATLRTQAARADSLMQEFGERFAELDRRCLALQGLDTSSTYRDLLSGYVPFSSLPNDWQGGLRLVYERGWRKERAGSGSLQMLTVPSGASRRAWSSGGVTKGGRTVEPPAPRPAFDHISVISAKIEPGYEFVLGAYRRVEDASMASTLLTGDIEWRLTPSESAAVRPPKVQPLKETQLYESADMLAVRVH